MSIKLYLQIAIRLILLFSTPMAFTFVTPELRQFFGDTICTSYCYDLVDVRWNWGVRHYWYFWLTTLLFLLSAFYSFIHIRKLVIKEFNL